MRIIAFSLDGTFMAFVKGRFCKMGAATTCLHEAIGDLVEKQDLLKDFDIVEVSGEHAFQVFLRSNSKVRGSGSNKRQALGDLLHNHWSKLGLIVEVS